MTFNSHHPTLEVGQAHKARLQRMLHGGKRSSGLKRGDRTAARETSEPYKRVRGKEGAIDYVNSSSHRRNRNAWPRGGHSLIGQAASHPYLDTAGVSLCPSR